MLPCLSGVLKLPVSGGDVGLSLSWSRLAWLKRNARSIVVVDLTGSMPGNILVFVVCFTWSRQTVVGVG